MDKVYKISGCFNSQLITEICVIFVPHFSKENILASSLANNVTIGFPSKSCFMQHKLICYNFGFFHRKLLEVTNIVYISWKIWVSQIKRTFFSGTYGWVRSANLLHKNIHKLGQNRQTQWFQHSGNQPTHTTIRNVDASESAEVYVRTMRVCDILHRTPPKAKFCLALRTVYKHRTLVAEFVSHRAMCFQLWNPTPRILGLTE